MITVKSATATWAAVRPVTYARDPIPSAAGQQSVKAPDRAVSFSASAGEAGRVKLGDQVKTNLTTDTAKQLAMQAKQQLAAQSLPMVNNAPQALIALS